MFVLCREEPGVLTRMLVLCDRDDTYVLCDASGEDPKCSDSLPRWDRSVEAHKWCVYPRYLLHHLRGNLNRVARCLHRVNFSSSESSPIRPVNISKAYELWPGPLPNCKAYCGLSQSEVQVFGVPHGLRGASGRGGEG